MTKITIGIIGQGGYGRPGFFHCTSGIVAVVQDEKDESKAFWVSPVLNRVRDKTTFSDESKAETVVLYSAVSYQEFIDVYSKRYLGGDTSCHLGECYEPTCADIVNFTLNTFFPHESAYNAFFKAFQSLFCLCSLLTCGTSCFPAPPCVNTPSDVFKKAVHLAKTYGHPLSVEMSEVEKEQKAIRLVA